MTELVASVVMAGAAYRALVPLLLAAQGRCVRPAVGHAAVCLSSAAVVVIAHNLHESNA